MPTPIIHTATASDEAAVIGVVTLGLARTRRRGGRILIRAAEDVTLEIVEVIDSPLVTHLAFRVAK